MDLHEHAVYDEYYFGLKANGWSKLEAAKAARRHVRQMSRRKIKEEVTRILAQKETCRVCGTEIHSAELCAQCADGNDPFVQSKYSDRR